MEKIKIREIRGYSLQGENYAKYESLKLVAEKVNEIIEHINNPTNSCPPHDLMDYKYGAWGGTTAPPTKICKKCLITV